MRTSNNKKPTLFFMGILIFGLLIFSGVNIYADQLPDIHKPSASLTKLIIQNYIKGLQSDNVGLRNSCIFFSVKYNISESLSTLKDLYEKEENMETKVLIFHALNQLGDKKAVSTVKNYLKGLTSDNEGLRKSCISFVGQYKITEAVNTLIEEQQKETNPEIKGLISLALNEINSENDLLNFAEKQ